MGSLDGASVIWGTANHNIFILTCIITTSTHYIVETCCISIYYTIQTKVNYNFEIASLVCLMCLEGSDCLGDASCEECSGVACTRITSFNMEDNREVALTCLPYDTRCVDQ
uniref:Laminin EGF-like domain-containing protein n=1 Tax=Heterorhabditis bacteriophora TaxID=37862 RepID=A0A1I7XK88_HETBA